jgi:hypothetical protein
MQIVNPFYGIETGGGGSWKFLSPAVSREALKPSVLWRKESSLHDSDALHRVLYASVTGTSMFE